MTPKFPVSSQPIPKNAKKVFKGEVFEVWQWQQTMFDGSVKTFEKAKRNSSVGVIPVTTSGEIALTIQEQPLMKPFVSLLGGVVDDGEQVLEAVERELLEEAGLKAKQVDFWYSHQLTTKVEWPIYMFIARKCEKVAEQNLDSGEKIKLKYVNWDEFLNLAVKDNFRDKDITFKLLKAMQKEGELEKIRKFVFKN